jgi:hypothetical protein
MTGITWAVPASSRARARLSSTPTDVIRNEKIGADQQQDDISRLKPGVGGAGPIGTGGDIAFVPDLDQPLPVEDRISSQACDHSTHDCPTR